MGLRLETLPTNIVTKGQNYRPAFNGILNRGGELTLLELHPKKKIIQFLIFWESSKGVFLTSSNEITAQLLMGLRL